MSSGLPSQSLSILPLSVAKTSKKCADELSKGNAFNSMKLLTENMLNGILLINNFEPVKAKTPAR